MDRELKLKARFAERNSFLGFFRKLESSNDWEAEAKVSKILNTQNRHKRRNGQAEFPIEPDEFTLNAGTGRMKIRDHTE